MTTWFTADTHFGHGGALGLFRRPFEGVAAMDEAMVARWNETVAPHDDVWHLGDFALAPPERMVALFERLRGRKRLVVGNNDTAGTRSLPWDEVTDYAETAVDGLSLVLCHYPLRSWKNDGRGWWNLHGHSHHRLKPLTRQRDVGVDGFDFRPVGAGTLARRWPPSRLLDPRAPKREQPRAPGQPRAPRGVEGKTEGTEP